MPDSVQRVLERLAGLEHRSLGSSDLDGLAGARVFADTRGAGLDLEGAKADELHLVASFERVLDGGGERLQRRTSVLLGEFADFRQWRKSVRFCS